jgi:xanthine/CO dehydrogenase XdhC/CoxF family maturation factor
LKELHEIIKAYDLACQAGKQTALATVVHVDGSSYRRPGARMLVDDEGLLTGAISGGCLEGDALRKALLALAQQKTKLVSYDTSNEDDMSIGIQLGCAGIIQVLFEPIDPSDANNPIELIRSCLSSRQKAVLLTLFSLDGRYAEQIGTCTLLKHNGSFTGDVTLTQLHELIRADMQEALSHSTSIFKSYQDGAIFITGFIEYMSPPISLVIVGAGNDAIPMMQLADMLGWESRIVDGRNTHAKPERFEAACQVLVSKPEAVLEKIPVDDRTAFVMMTHNYNYDLAMLKALLPLDIPYIGMLGPKKKTERMLHELREAGMEITEKMLEKVYGPTGLEIGAETPEEIALSITAEILSVMNGTPGGQLKRKNDVIHSRSNSTINIKKL